MSIRAAARQLARHPVLRPFLAALLCGVVGAAVCAWLNTPLPWMIGPLFASATLRLAGRHLCCPVRLREAGQGAIGSALGLYFTAPVLAVRAAYSGLIAGAVSFALALGWACRYLLHEISGAQRVAAAHGMRIML